MQVYQWNKLDDLQRSKLLQRPVELVSETLKSSVSEILSEVKAGDKAKLLEITERIDGVKLTSLQVPEAEIQAALTGLEGNLYEALSRAKRNIEAFHKMQKPQGYSLETLPGVICERQYRAIEKVGLYIPAGSAPLFSTVLMLAIPAQLAGCRQIFLCTPPQQDGRANAAVLAAAALCGVNKVFTLGGAQAIGAMAYGRGGIPKVDKIFGPGNAWVTEAKTQVSQSVPGLSIDMPAGPSEVLVIADGCAKAEFVAWDLLSQAEHGPDSQAVLISTSGRLCEEVLLRVTELIEESPRRDQLLQSFAHMRAFEVADLNEAVVISNEYAPEHLILNIEAPRKLLSKVENAGSVFLGAWTPESAGDYASGTNHVLPTSGYARSIGGLTLNSFMKSMTVQELSPEGVKELSSTVETMAQAEGLSAHEKAMAVRRIELESK